MFACDSTKSRRLKNDQRVPQTERPVAQSCLIYSEDQGRVWED